MRWTHRLQGWALISLPIIVLLVCSAIYLIKLSLYLSPRLAPIVAQIASDSLNRQVHVDTVDVFNSLGTVVLNHVVISNAETFAQDTPLPALKVDRVVVKYNVPYLLSHPLNAVGCVRTISLTDPSAYIERLPTGKFNFSDLLVSKSKKKSPPFLATIVVTGGTLVVRDAAAPTPFLRLAHKFHNIVGSADLTNANVVTFLASGQGDSQTVHSFRINGQVSRSSSSRTSKVRQKIRHGFGLKMQFADANIAQLAPYFTTKLAATARILSGRGQGEVTVQEVGTERTAYNIAGTISVAHASVGLVNSKLINVPITGINGNALFTQDYVTFNSDASVSDQSVTLSGTVVGFKTPNLYVEIDGKSLSYSRLHQALPFLPNFPPLVIPGNKLSAQTWVTGTLRKPAFDVSLQVPALTVYGSSIKNVEANLSYVGKVVQVHSVDVGAGSTSRVSAAGTIDLSGSHPIYHFYGQAKSFALADVPFPANIRHAMEPLSASVSGIFDATQAGVQAKVSSSNGVIHGIPYSVAEAQIYYNSNSSLDIQRLFIRQHHSGLLVASGTVPLGRSPQPIAVQFRTAQLDVSSIGQAFLNTPIGGYVYATGSIGGLVSNPQIASHVFVLQPKVGPISLNVLRVDISGSADRLDLNNLVVRDVPATSDATGYVTNIFSKNPGVNLTLAYRDLPLSFLTSLRAAKNETPAQLPITGFISGKATVVGPIASPDVQSSVVLDDGVFQDFQITNTSAEVAYHKSLITVDGVRATVAGVNIAGSGTYRLSGAISLDLNATASDLGIITQRYVPALQIFGGLQVAATVGGAVDNPTVTAVLSTKDVSVEGSNLSVSPVTFQYQSNYLKMTRGDLSVTAGPATYSLSEFALNLQSKTVDARGSEVGETLTHLIAAFQKSAYLQNKMGGSLNAILARMPEQPTGNLRVTDVTVDGPIQYPKVTVNATLSSAKVAGQPIDSLQVNTTVLASKVSVQTFRLTGPNDAFLEASGTVDSAGPVDAKVEASGFNLSLLNPFMSGHLQIGGRLSDLTVIAEGATRAPDVSASITLDKPSLGDLKLDRIDSGEIDVRDNHITVNGLTFTKEETASGSSSIVDHTLTIAGSIPFRWRAGEILQGEIPSTVPISLTADIPNQSISFVNQMLPSLPVRMPAGSISGHVEVTGTLADKIVNGTFSLSGASLQADGYQTSFKNINIALSLAGKQFNFTKFDAQSSYGGTIDLSGGGQFTGSELLDPAVTTNSELSDLILNVKAGTSNLVLNERKLALFENAGVTARVNSSLTVVGPVLRPMIAGKIAVDKVIGSLPATTTTAAPETEAPKFNPRFNIGVSIEPEAQLKTAQLNAQADGSLTLAGSLYRPRIDGTFLIRKGQFYFPTATFKVVPVGTVDLHFHPPLDVSENIQMTATTMISVSPDLIARNPAGANTTSTYVPPSLTNTASSASQRYNITVNINGDLVNPDRLHLSFQSDPAGLTDAQILAVLGGQQAIAGLTGGNIVTALQTQVASVFNASVVPKMLQPLEDTIGTVLGLEDFSVDYAPESPVQVTIVKRLGSRLSVQYTQSVNPRQPGAVSSTLEPPEYQVKLGYSFTPRLQVTISTDDQNNNIVAIEGVHNF